MALCKYGEKVTEGLSGRGRDGPETGKYRMRVELFLVFGKTTGVAMDGGQGMCA